MSSSDGFDNNRGELLAEKVAIVEEEISAILKKEMQWSTKALEGREALSKEKPELGVSRGKQHEHAKRRERQGSVSFDNMEKEMEGDWEPGEAYKRIDVGYLNNAEGWVSTRKRASSAPAHFRY